MSQQTTLIEGQKEYFKSLLTKTLDELLKEAKPSSDNTTRLKDDNADFIDQAAIETDSSLAFRIKERDSRLMRKIKEALTRLENGSFGICEECGRRISEARLKARPVATLCITCKERQECDERIRGL